MPIPIIPEQDVEPWAKALEELMTDQNLYVKESDAAREAALRFVPTVKASHFEEYLLTLQPTMPEAAQTEAGQQQRQNRKTIEDLSPEKRALLLKKLRERTGKN